MTVYPGDDESVNAELCRVLSYLDSPDVVRKTIRLMKSTRTKTLAYDKEMLDRHEYGRDILKMMSNTPNSQNIHYAYSLRRVQRGWTLEDRKFYFGEIHKTPMDTVKKVELSQASMMPPGTIFAMNKDELMNLVAYLISAGNQKHKVFERE